MDKTYLGRRLAEFSPGIASQPITKVELLDENGDLVGVSGSDTGRTLTALQPDGTNAMAAAILAKVSDNIIHISSKIRLNIRSVSVSAVPQHRMYDIC